MAGAGRRRWLRGQAPYTVLLLLIAFLAGVLLILPWIFGPRVEILPSPYPGNPFSLSLSIANQNLTPFTGIEYSCAAENVEPAGEPLAHDPKAVHEGRRLRLPGREAMAARCDMAYLITAPLKSAQYKLTLHYSVFPWRKIRTSEHYFLAQLDNSGQVTGWSPK
jgi:hypothetical protein